LFLNEMANIGAEGRELCSGGLSETGVKNERMLAVPPVSIVAGELLSGFIST
jgi:hypothetical protein